jgi:pimeloyl-ACP methyl ester carboxylesterase
MPADNILLLPGMMCDSRLWAGQEPYFTRPVYHADCRRHDSIAAIADSVLAAAPGRFAIAGLSMGGIVAFEIWRQAPERVTHLALLDTNPHAEAADRQSMRLEQIEAATSGKLRELATDSLKPLYLAKAHRDDDELLDRILEMALDLGADVFRNQSLALRSRVDSVPILGSISCPTLVLCGDEDRLCPPAYHELMAEKIPGARLEIVSKCGHLSSMEQPQVVTRALNSLFAQ